MSVVNKMLKDLEERKAEPDYSAEYQPSNNKSASLVSILFLVVILVLAVGIWLFKDKIFAEDNQPISLPEVAAVSDQKVKDETEEKNKSNGSKAEINPQQKMLTSEFEDIAEVKKIVEVEKMSVEESVQSRIPNTDIASDLEPSVFAENTTAKNATEAEAEREVDDLIEQQSQSQQIVQTYKEQLELPDSDDNSAQPAEEQQSSKQQLTKHKVSSQTSSQQFTSLAKSDSQSAEGVFEMKSSNKTINKEDLRQQVQIALKKGDERSAIRLLTQLVKLTPENTNARKRLAAMLFAQGDHGQADTVLQQGIDLFSGNVELRLMKARLYEQVKKPLQGFDVLMAHSVSVYQAPDYIAYRAALAQKVENFAQAKLDYQQLIKSQTANAKWWLGLAVVEERMGNMVGALDAYQHVKQLSQMSVEVEDFVEQRIRYLAEVK